MRAPFPHLFSKVGRHRSNKGGYEQRQRRQLLLGGKDCFTTLGGQKKITVRMRSIDDFQRNNLLNWGEGLIQYQPSLHFCKNSFFNSVSSPPCKLYGMIPQSRFQRPPLRTCVDGRRQVRRR